MKVLSVLVLCYAVTQVQGLSCNYEGTLYEICRNANAWSYENGAVCVGITRCISQSPPYGVTSSTVPPKTTTTPPVTATLPPPTTTTPPVTATLPPPPTTTTRPPPTTTTPTPTPGNGCPYRGNISYSLTNSWPQQYRDTIIKAMDKAIYYYNCYGNMSKQLLINYKEGVPTAEAGPDGYISFGANTGYMQTPTAMHEIAHTLGVGFYPWVELQNNGRFTGAAVNQFMQNLPANERDSDSYSQRTYITCDKQHFWPYGLNQAAEYKTEWSLINNVRIVQAIQIDKQTYLNSH